MKRHPSDILGISLLALAGSVLTVGVVWASSSALRDGSGTGSSGGAATVDSIPGDEPDGDLPPVDPGDPEGPGGPGTPDQRIDELTRLVGALSTQVGALSDAVAAQTARIEKVEQRVTEVEVDFDAVDKRWAEGLRRLEEASTDIEQARSDAADAIARATVLGGTVSTLERRTARLADDGSYTGVVNPSQLSRRLTSGDLGGDWPLDRTSGSLKSSSIEVSASGCWADSRHNTVLSVDPFRRLECLRIAK